MVLADFSGVPAGTKGVVSEVYDEGVMVAWIGLKAAGVNMTENAIRDAIDKGKCYPAAGFDTDGFSRDELEYLAVGTEKLHRRGGV